ncbi:MAG: LamG-like jellyroll fold domain-containing protein [Verrucomicrobiota bacterium]
MKNQRTDGGGVSLRMLARALLPLAVLACMAGPASAESFEFRESSNPAGIISPWTTPVEAGETKRVRSFAVVSGAYRFGFWTINGSRQAFPSGQAYLYPEVTVNGAIDAVAHFFPVAEDGDGDRLADWWEFWMFGDRTRGPQDDDDGDGRNHEEEFRNGYSAQFRDDVRAGGIASRLSAPLRLIVRNRLRYTLRSEPLGLVSAAGEVAPGGSYTTPYLLGDVSGFTFVGFEVDGQPVRDVSGFYRSRITVIPAADTGIVARYVPAGSDSDGDGIKDAVEYQNFGNLANGPASDPDGDSFTIAEELKRGWNLIAADEVISGGISARLSGPLEYDRVRSRYGVRSLPLGLIPTVTEQVVAGSERTSPHLGTGLVSGYAFGYWSVNGVRVAGPEGIARRQVKVKVTVNGATELVANFFLPNQDGDGDGLPDWWEWNSFGTLAHTQDGDPDGDGFTLADERRLGLAVANRDVLVDGGIAARLSAPLNYESGSRKRLAVSSTPRGIVPETQQYLAPASQVVSSHYNFAQLYSGYYFTHWTRNGVRETDGTNGTGYSRNRTIFPLLVDTELVAHFVMPGDDGDGDGIPDYLEFRLADDLDELGPDADPDGDALTFAAERRLGLSPLLRDSICDGGVSSRMSAPVAMQFSVPPLALVPERLQTVNGAPAGARVGVLAVSPAMPGRTYQFALELGAGGDDNSRFVMAGNELQLAAALQVTGQILRVRIRATDDLGVSRSWQAMVNVADSLIAPLGFRTVAEGTPLEVRPEIGVAGMSDQTSVITVVSTPAGSHFNAASGLWSWTPNEADGPGVFAVTLRADNGVMTSDRTFQVMVTETNLPPTMEPVPLQNAAIDEPWSLQLVASDPDLPANTLTFALVDAPAGATINAASGRVTWTPGSEHLGTTVVFQASVRDGLATTTIPLEIRVVLALPPVVVNAPANQTSWFTGDGDTRDFLGLSPAGVLRGGAKFGVGKVGQDFELDGNGDYIEIADNPQHRSTTGALTVECWFKLNTRQEPQVILSKPLSGSNSNSYCIWYQGGQLRGGNGNLNTFHTLFSGLNPEPGVWYHAAITVSETTSAFYINGSLVSSSSSSPALYFDPGATAKPLLLGSENEGNNVPTFFMNGSIDEVSLYDRALSQAELAGIHTAGLGGKIKEKTTPAGLNVQTQLSDVTISFSGVTTAGLTRQTGTGVLHLPALPPGATFAGLAYDLSSTASYQNATPNDVRVDFNVPGLASLNFAKLRILQLVNGAWLDRTDPSSAAGVLHTRKVASLSQFAIVESDSPLGVEAWRLAEFGAAYGDPSVSGLTADPNHNGLPNLLEYALGRDPLASGGVSGISQGIIQIGNERYQTLSYTRPTGLNEATDVIYSPRRSTSLGSAWFTTGILPVGVVPGPGALETVTVRSTTPMNGQPKEFLRLEVMLEERIPAP